MTLEQCRPFLDSGLPLARTAKKETNQEQAGFRMLERETRFHGVQLRQANHRSSSWQVNDAGPEADGLSGAFTIFFNMARFCVHERDPGTGGGSIALLTGNDRFITESILLGAQVALLGFGAVGCRLIAEMLSCAAQGDFKAVVEQRPRLHAFALMIYKDRVLDYRAGCKAALAELGVIGDEIYVRPPLYETGQDERAQVRTALEKAGMLEEEPA